MLRNQRGAVAVVVGISIFVLVGFGALAVDISHLHVARNELQNAADAGALAGARVLYNDDGTAVNVGANQEAYDAATANKSEGTAVEVDWSGGNGGEVQRGHWSFGLVPADLERGFYDNDSTTPVELWNVSTEELDANPDFINAVKVVTRRTTEGTPVASFLAGIFGYENFELSAEAVAYIGYAGKLNPGDVDQPIAICEESVEIGENYSCNIGRMLNSGPSDATHNTAGWSNFSQPCTTANAAEMAQLVCADGNPAPINYGEGMGATGGVQQSTLTALRDCWLIGMNDLDNDGVRETPIDTDGDGIPDQPWNLTLPVISCPGNNIANCAEVKGAVNLDIIWMTKKELPESEEPEVVYADAPEKMAGWSYPADPDNTNGQERWNSFVSYFNLKNADDEDAPYAKKSIYFLPDCDYHEPKGVSGGENFGILADIPVLVQ